MADKFNMGPKLVIDGEAEFKKAVAGINKEMTVLGSEMRKVTAQFDDNAGSMEALTAKSEVYNKQIDEQKKKVKTLTDAMEASKKEYGENSDKVKEWQIKLNNAEAALSKTESELKKTKNQMDNFGKETSDTTTEVKQLDKKMEAAGKQTISFGDILKANLLSDAIVGGFRVLGSAISSAFGELKQLASEAMDSSDELVKLSSETGFTTDKLQEMQFIGDDLGVSLDTQTGALSKMINNMSDAKKGTGTASDAFKKLGINVTDANGNLRDSNTVYAETLDALGNVTNETERTAIAQDIFGKSAADLNPLIEAGSQGLADLAQKAKDSGAIMSNETVTALDNLGDSVDHLKQTAQTAAGTLLSQFAPALDDVANNLSGLMNGSVSPDQFMASIQTLITQVTDTLTAMLPQLLETGAMILTTLLNGVVAALPDLIPAAVEIVMNLVDCILDNLPALVEAGMQIILQLAMAIAGSLPDLIPTIVDTVLMIVDTLIDNIDLLLEAAMAIIMALAEGLIKALPKLIAKIPDIVIGIVEGFAKYYGKMGEVGLNLITGLWNGIKDAAGWLKNKISGFVNDVIRNIKNFFGIASPSKVMAGLGGYLSEGLADGITGKSGLVTDAMDQINKDLSAEANMAVSATGSGQSFSAAQYQSMSETNLLLRELLAAVGQDVRVPMNIDGRQFGELTLPGIRRAQLRTNTSLALNVN